MEQGSVYTGKEDKCQAVLYNSFWNFQDRMKSDKIQNREYLQTFSLKAICYLSYYFNYINISHLSNFEIHLLQFSNSFCSLFTFCQALQIIFRTFKDVTMMHSVNISRSNQYYYYNLLPAINLYHSVRKANIDSFHLLYLYQYI